MAFVQKIAEEFWIADSKLETENGLSSYQFAGIYNTVSSAKV